jgi:hypothetical protein
MPEQGLVADAASKARDGDHTRRIFAWLNQILGRVRDGALTASAFLLAYALGQYLNRKTGVAFPSRAELARATGYSVRTVQTLLTALLDDGQIEILSGCGRHHVSTYRPLIAASQYRKQASPFPDERRKRTSHHNNGPRVQSGVEKGEVQRQERGSTLPTEPSDEPFEEPSESIEGALFPDESKKRSTKKELGKQKAAKRKSPMPADWPDAALQAEAGRFWRAHDRPDSAAGIDHHREQARNNHAAKGSKFVDWDAAWRTWYRNTVRFERMPPNSAGGANRRRSNLSLVAEKLLSEVQDDR